MHYHRLRVSAFFKWHICGDGEFVTFVSTFLSSTRKCLLEYVMEQLRGNLIFWIPKVTMQREGLPGSMRRTNCVMLGESVYLSQSIFHFTKWTNLPSLPRSPRNTPQLSTQLSSDSSTPHGCHLHFASILYPSGYCPHLFQCSLHWAPQKQEVSQDSNLILFIVFSAQFRSK